MNFIKSIWAFFGKYQTNKIRYLHFYIMILVLVEILVSYGMTGTKLSIIPFDRNHFFSWAHIILGLLAFYFTCSFIVSSFVHRGLKYFYPYLWGEFKQLKEDLEMLFKFKLPDSSPKGLAPIVQGLGLGALLLVVLSGVLWFLFWFLQLPLALEIRSIHKSLTLLLEIYICGHGTLAIIHFIIWHKNKKINF